MERPGHAICFACGKVLRLPPRADGVPRWCRTKPCHDARQRWRWQHDAALRAYHRALCAYRYRVAHGLEGGPKPTYQTDTMRASSRRRLMLQESMA